MTRALVPGLYELIVTRGLEAALEAIDRRAIHVERRELDPADAHLVLAHHGYEVLVRALAALPGEDEDRLHAQVGLLNAVIESLHRALVNAGLAEEFVTSAAEELRALVTRGVLPMGEVPRVERPGIPLAASALLVNARDEHRVGHELRRELASADEVDLICAFIKWNGLRLLEQDVRAVLDRGGRLRVLTSVYLAATEGDAIDALCRWGADVRVSYDTRRTRLHAKAWLFRRNSGFSTAYIGSSNISVSALVDGLEWNVRLSRVDVPEVLEKFQAAFDGYWEDPEFEPYDPARDRERFECARKVERPQAPFELLALDVNPYPHQQEILDRLTAERDLHCRWKNLVVAATGTGKTVIAALDYRRVRRMWGEARLLYVAHRREILHQSRSTFRAVLRDGSFGELWSEGERPVGGKHVFASIQTLARVDLDGMSPDVFEVVIVDEVHHAEARTYERLLAHLRPRLLLGLTATPERADGEDIRRWFDGRVAAELRLWTALERGLLCPFQYFGLHDDVDLSAVQWKRGGYDPSALERVYVLSREIAVRRVRLVAQALADKVRDLRGMRALGFCVSVRHAEFMAEEFAKLGIPAVAVSAQTPMADRERALRRLKDREVNVVFAVDLFNEGVDVPEVDTVVFLRPTESPTVFLQQLGRGLRLAEGKACLTVLDMIGRPSRRFRFDLRFRALLGGSRAGLERALREEFPVLPPGCAIRLDRDAHRVVLDNVRQALQQNVRSLADELQVLAGELGRPPRLGEFLERAKMDVDELYRRRGQGVLTWSRLRRAAGIALQPPGYDDDALAAGLTRLVHVDDEERLGFYREILGASAPPRPGLLDDHQQRLLSMLHFSIWGARAPDRDIEASLARLWANPGRSTSYVS